MYNPDTQLNILMQLDIDDVSNLCMLNPSFKKTCSSPYFWSLYFEKYYLPFPETTYNMPGSWIKAFKNTEKALDLLDYLKEKEDLYVNPKLHIELANLDPEIITNVINDPEVIQFLNKYYKAFDPNAFTYDLILENVTDGYEMRINLEDYYDQLDHLVIDIDNYAAFLLIYNLLMHHINIIKTT